MSFTTVATLVDALAESKILTQQQLDVIAKDMRPQFKDPKLLARELIQRRWLTPFQVNQIAKGRIGNLVLGPYLLLERLGQGGMGEVYKARHQIMHRDVALKLVRSDQANHGDLIARFQREIRAASRLSHPNIVIAHDAGQAGSTLYFAMELIDGTDLGKLVKKNGPLPVTQACEYIHQGLLGLQHAHECGLVHRDIKPGNIMVTADGSQVKLLDYGLARIQEEAVTGELTADGLVMGTPDFIAPEQIEDFHHADIRSDIYSLGCTFYYLLSGQPPFPKGTAQEKLIRQREIPPQPIEILRPDLPRPVIAIVSKMMAKSPNERYQTPREAAEEFSRITRDYSINARHNEARTLSALPPSSSETENDPAIGQSVVSSEDCEQTNPHAVSRSYGAAGYTAKRNWGMRRWLIFSIIAVTIPLFFAGMVWLILTAVQGNNAGSTTKNGTNAVNAKGPTSGSQLVDLPLPFPNESKSENPPTPVPPPSDLTKGELLFEDSFENDPNASQQIYGEKNGRFGRKDGKYFTEIFAGTPKGRASLNRFGTKPSAKYLAEAKLQYAGGDLIAWFGMRGNVEDRTQFLLMVRPDGQWQIIKEWAKLVDGDSWQREKTKPLLGHRPNDPALKQGQWIKLQIRVVENVYEIKADDYLLARFSDQKEAGNPRQPASPPFMLGIASDGVNHAQMEIDYVRIWRLESKN